MAAFMLTKGQGNTTAHRPHRLATFDLVAEPGFKAEEVAIRAKMKRHLICYKREK